MLPDVNLKVCITWKLFRKLVGNGQMSPSMGISEESEDVTITPEKNTPADLKIEAKN